ncbi:MAG: tRNA pseudouridine(55) synthase TruB [Ruminococcaceae bacterium]|nr:tRNA pseudouridine(55) synthase TruB [Oscillospiraceae bacterium]
MAKALNGILPVIKPEGWTSHDVVAKLRGITRVKRIGHSGTLDPMATGVLLLFIGRATRAVQFAEANDKTYIAKMRLGIETDTQDITGTVVKLSEQAASFIDEDNILSILPKFSGDIFQLPPMYSAIKKDGKKLYELARAGKEVEREKRQINISELKLIGKEKDDYVLSVSCSKGTYIRTLCHDIGKELGCGACMSALCRTRVGNFTINDAHELEIIINKGAEEFLLPVDSLFKEYPEQTATVAEEKYIKNGVAYKTQAPDGTYRIYSENGEFLMLGEVNGNIMSTIKSFFEV